MFMYFGKKMVKRKKYDYLLIWKIENQALY